MRSRASQRRPSSLPSICRASLSEAVLRERRTSGMFACAIGEMSPASNQEPGLAAMAAAASWIQLLENRVSQRPHGDSPPSPGPSRKEYDVHPGVVRPDVAGKNCDGVSSADAATEGLLDRRPDKRAIDASHELRRASPESACGRTRNPRVVRQLCADSLGLSRDV